MKEKKEQKRLKSDNWFFACLLILGLIVLGELLTLPISKFGKSFAETIPEVYTLCTYLETIGTWIALLLFMFIYKPDRELIPLIGKRGGNTLKNAFIGLAIGVGMNTICVIVSCLNKDISLVFKPSSIGYLLLGFIVVFIQSSGEELCFRHFLQRHLRRGYNSPWVEILIPSAWFMVLHFGNNGINVFGALQLALMSICTSLIVYYFDSLWMCFMLHTGWNFTQAMIFGLPNSGKVYPLYIFKLDAARDGCWLGYDVNFGVEGSFLAVFELTIVLIVVIILGQKRKAAEDHMAHL